MKFEDNFTLGNNPNKTFFTLGPCEMFPETLKIESMQTPYFRNKEYSFMHFEIEKLIKKLTFSEENTKVVILTASGTGAMESAVLNCLDKNKDKVLIINGGNFGKTFKEIVALHNISFEEILLEFNEKLQKEHLEQFNNKGITAVLVNIHESSTGQLYDRKIISDFCRLNNAYFIMDGISSFLADEINIKEDSIDVLLLSSQKALALNPGLSIILLSEKIYDERIKNSPSKSFYFDYNSYIDNGKRGQPPFTPAIKIVETMVEALQRIDKEGIENKIKKTRDIAITFREAVKHLPITFPKFTMSNAVTTLLFEKHNSAEVSLELKNKCGFITNTRSGYGFGSKVLPVGHFGNINKNDILKFANALEEIL